VVTYLEGVKICHFPTTNCVTTDWRGMYDLAGLPSSGEVLLEFTLPGYFPLLRTGTFQDGSVGFARWSVGVTTMLTTAEFNALAGMLGAAPDPAKGHIMFTAYSFDTDHVMADVSVAMTPMSGIGPAYWTDTDPAYLSLGLTATSTAGSGVYGNVDTGEVDINFTHPDRVCPRLPGFTWAGSQATSCRVPVHAGYATLGAYVWHCQ
jgi:hypothetical protein